MFSKINYAKKGKKKKEKKIKKLLDVFWLWLLRPIFEWEVDPFHFLFPYFLYLFHFDNLLEKKIKWGWYKIYEE